MLITSNKAIGIVIKPRLATIPPIVPFRLLPMNVETFKAIIPGVH